MKRIGVGIIGTGWCGGIRAETCAANPVVSSLHVAEIRPERLDEIAKATGARTAVIDYRQLLAIADVEAIYISATPETTHYPMARDCLLADKHVFLEKPIALSLVEADDLIALARERKLKFTIGYSQRFNPKFAYVRKSIRDGSIGRPVSALVSRHITRNLGKKISGRIKLSPAAMEATHDLDFVLWCLEPAKPVRVYSQINFGTMRETTGAQIPDTALVEAADLPAFAGAPAPADVRVVERRPTRVLLDVDAHGPARSFIAINQTWDDRWRTGGTVDEVIAEAHLSPQHLLAGIERFAKERPQRLGRVRDAVDAALSD